ncbi:unnamed protein product [Cyprideis torosa]|uniref:Uncharacterized protein n=1 Tax=Cyprideis torosa TaxID=163714 RepID=A0A7R8WPS9_9CRUS|nr:unnamed protein product [Cyprideis torosa]CAG0907448.1 unnamed protein product [Cyprideis torosa]
MFSDSSMSSRDFGIPSSTVSKEDFYISSSSSEASSVSIASIFKPSPWTRLIQNVLSTSTSASDLLSTLGLTNASTEGRASQEPSEEGPIFSRRYNPDQDGGNIFHILLVTLTFVALVYALALRASNR